MEVSKLASRQVFWLFVNSRFIISLVFIPAVVDLPNTRDLFPATFVFFVFIVPYVLVFVSLWLQYPNQTLVEYSPILLGRFLGKAVGGIYIGYFIFNAALTLRIFNDFLLSRFYIQTPQEVIGCGILLITAYCVYMGPEVLGRCAEVLVPMIFLGLILLMMLAIPNARWTYVIPTWETDLLTLIKANLPTISRYSELTWMAMVVPLIADQQHIKRDTIRAVLFVTAFGYSLIIFLVAIFGPDLIKTLQFPTFNMVEIISVGDFLERIDALVLGMWVIGAFLKIGIFYYVAVLGASQWLGIREYKPLVLPTGLIIMVLSLLLFANIGEVKAFGSSMVSVDLLAGFVIPLLMLTVHGAKKWLRRERRRGQA
ncbi:GerAB/ArcD/ProY family transporter [Paenibacillus sp. strain BS8-2]